MFYTVFIRMKTHRKFHISFSGIIVGVLLGAGIVALSGQTSLSANIAAVSRTPFVSLLHSAPARADFVRRNIVRKTIPLRNDDGTTNTTYLTIQAESSSTSAKTATLTTCDAVRNAVEKIRKVYADIVAGAVSNAEIRQTMFDVIADASDDGCVK